MTLSMEQLLDFEPEKWDPEPGDKAHGEIVRVQTFTDDFNPGDAYPVIDLLTDAEVLAGVRVYASRTVLRNELGKFDVRVGDRLGIKYHGKTLGKTREYERYTVVHQPKAQPPPAGMTVRPQALPQEPREVFAGALTEHLRERALTRAGGGNGAGGEHDGSGRYQRLADDDVPGDDYYVPPDEPLSGDDDV